jgi:hypothetical protein
MAGVARSCDETPSHAACDVTIPTVVVDDPRIVMQVPVCALGRTDSNTCIQKIYIQMQTKTKVTAQLCLQHRLLLRTVLLWKPADCD